jgi:iron complex outermembrane receptor protein
MPADVQLDLEPYERFEVVKGATSTMFGQNTVAGTINAISKEPHDVFGGELSVEGGTFQHGRTTGDVYGPITEDGRWQYRLVGALTDEDSFLDVASKRVRAIVPTIRYQPSDATSITARINYQDQRLKYHFGNGVQCLCADLSQAQPGDFVMPDIKRSVFFGQSWNQAHKEATFAEGAFEHRFANDWHLRVGVQHSHVNEFSTADSEQAPTNTGVTVYGSLYTDEKEDTLYAGEVQLYGDVNVLGTRNTLFFGVDYQEQTGNFLQGLDTVFTGFNIFAPNYYLVAPRLSLLDYEGSPTNFFTNNINTVYETGITVQTFLHPIDGLTLLIGGRYSDVKLLSDRKSGPVNDDGFATVADFISSPFTRFTTVTDKFTVQTGLTYAITDNVNVYASYGQTFVPRVAIFEFDPNNPVGRPAPPEEGEAYEAGLKGEFLAKRLSASLAVFDMTRSNLTQPHPGTPLRDIVGTQKSTGVELELQGALTRSFNIFLSMAKVDPRYVGGRFDGLQPANGAKFGLSLFSTYEVRDGPLRGLGVGAGLVHKSGREFFGSDRRYANGQFVQFDYGSFSEVDARIFYNTQTWRFQVSGTNLFNEKYYSPAFDVLGFGIHVNPAPQVVARVTHVFGNR